MERKEQTGHICRWMALGIMTAIVIVGCTIVIGLFEWRDRKEIECRNAELHQWRKNVHDLNYRSIVFVPYRGFYFLNKNYRVHQIMTE